LILLSLKFDRSFYDGLCKDISINIIFVINKNMGIELTLLGMVAGSFAAVNHRNKLADIKSMKPMVITTS